jgi:branched-chain amino acid transport system substrate-binding protein
MAPEDEGNGVTGTLSRRQLVLRGGAGAGGLLIAGTAAACGSSSSSGSSGGSGGTAGTIKIGFVSPLTGPAAAFGEPDPYVIGLAKKAFAKGIVVAGKTYDVQIIEKDSQATPSVSAQVASELIHSDDVDIMLATSTPESVNPASDAAEAAGVPCISTVVPWEAWYYGRGAKPGAPSPFHYTYHFCFGVQQFDDTYTHLWPQVMTNKTVGVMWPNDADGNAIRAALGPLLKKAGYTIVDPGAYQDGTNDYTSQIALFKSKNCEIFNTFPLPPDFATFWRQAAQQGYTSMVKIAQIAKTGLFESQVDALGSLGANLATGFYWGPTWPYSSSLTGISNADLASGYETASGKQWNQQIGASMALFDVANAVLKASGDPKNKKKVADTMKTLTVDTPLGKLAWGSGPVPNVVATPIPGGQWVKGTKYPLEFHFCENFGDTNIPVAAKLVPYNS